MIINELHKGFDREGELLSLVSTLKNKERSINPFGILINSSKSAMISYFAPSNLSTMAKRSVFRADLKEFVGQV